MLRGSDRLTASGLWCVGVTTKACVGVIAQQIIHVDALPIHRHIVQVGCDALQQLLAEEVAGIFEQHFVARLRQPPESAAGWRGSRW